MQQNPKSNRLNIFFIFQTSFDKQHYIKMILQNRNKIKTEIKNNEGLLIYKDINKNSKIESEILVDSIWQYKENYVTKFLCFSM